MIQKKKLVVLEGLGECGFKRWLPALLEFRDSIEIVTVDILDRENLPPQIFSFNKKKKNFDTVKNNLFKMADFVFIINPNETHVETSLEYLKQNPKVKIIIEKPIAHEIADAKRLLPFGDRVVMVDHYRVKSYKTLEQMDITSAPANMFLCEPWAVETVRISTLRLGMIYDMFSHILTCIADVFAKQEGVTFSTVLKEIKIKNVNRFIYSPPPPPPYTGDTAAIITFTFREEEITSVLGKGLGIVEKKQMLVGDYLFNYKKNTISIDGNDIGTILSKPHSEVINKMLTEPFSNASSWGLVNLKDAIKILELTKTAYNFSNLIQIPFGAKIEDLFKLAR